MRVKLSNFRKWTDITFDLGDHVTKVTGESGKGKSTIFDAIYWCLYGKLRSVGPKGINGSRSKTEVIIDMCNPNIQVHRWGQKNVSIILGDEQYTGDMAQSKIDECFGCNDMFLMSSYLRAESIHPLITASPSEKRELTSLLFPGSSLYDRYKDKLSKLRSIDMQKTVELNNKIISSTSSISTLESTNPWLKDADPIDPTAASGSERDLISKIGSLSKERDRHVSIYTTYTSYKDQLSNLDPIIDTTSMEAEIASLRDRITTSLVNAMTKDDKIKSLNDRLSALVVPDDMPIEKCMSILQACTTLLSIAQSLQSIEDTIKSIDTKYGSANTLLIEYEKSMEDIAYNNRLINILECPSCHTKLRYSDTLSVVDGDVAIRPVLHNISKGDVDRLRISIEKMDSDKRKLVSDYNRYQSILSTCPYLVGKDIASCRDDMNRYIATYKERDTVQKELEIVSNDGREYMSAEERASIDSRINVLNTAITTNNSIRYTHATLCTNIATIERDNIWIKDYDTHISSINTSISSMKEELSQLKSIKERMRIQKMYISHVSDLSEYKANVSSLQSRIDDSHRLDHILAQSYNEYVGNKLKEIEYDISLLGKCFFDDTMNITLTPARESSTGTIKPSFDINIEYGGTVYDDIRMMSTGEKKRISIILMIVLTKYTDGKMIMLDEAFTSVGIDCRGVMLSELSKMNIPIYITSHDELNGGYTSELDINAIDAP